LFIDELALAFLYAKFFVYRAVICHCVASIILLHIEWSGSMLYTKLLLIMLLAAAIFIRFCKLNCSVLNTIVQGCLVLPIAELLGAELMVGRLFLGK